MKILTDFYHKALKQLETGIEFEDVTKLKSFEKVSKMRFIPNDEAEKIDKLNQELSNELGALRK